MYISEYSRLGIGKFKYKLVPNSDGTGTPVNAINLAELPNRSSGFNRIFNGILYTGTGDFYTVQHPVTLDTLRILPVGNFDEPGADYTVSPVAIPVFVKLLSGTEGSYSYTHAFERTNEMYTTSCG